MTGMRGRGRFDPRLYQIAMLAGLLVYGQLVLGFRLGAGFVVATLAGALATQALLSAWRDGSRFEPRSALITALSLCLLLRTDLVWLGAAAGALAVGSKFAIRLHGKHVFNPANFALVVLALSTDRAWVSPGQWGSAATLGFAVAGLGALVVWRAERSDVTWAFLAAHAGLLFGRALWLGDPLAIPLHQLQSGALLVFAFFMISDPRTTPDSRAGRVAYAAGVASLALWLRFGWWEPNALLYALVACAPLVPLIDRLLPAPRHVWPGASGLAEGDPVHATRDMHPTRLPGPAPHPALDGAR